MMHEFGRNMWSGWGWIVMTVMMVFWIAMLALIVFAISRAFSHPTQASSGSDEDDRAMRMLRERFARGEITEDELRQASRTLRETAH